MLNKEKVDQRIKEDLEYEFVNKKRLTLPNYKYNATHAAEEHFCEAAILCKEAEMHPAQYIQVMWERMGDKSAFFSSSHIRGIGAKQAIKDYFDGEDSYKVEITNVNLNYEDMWNFQKELALRYINQGSTAKNVLMDSSLKFFAWFRILAMAERDADIIDKYKRIAKKEWNNALSDFAKEKNLDVDRILD